MKQVTIKKDIYNDDGVLLLSKGQEVLLTSDKLEFLKKHGNYEELISCEDQNSQDPNEVSSPLLTEKENNFDVSHMASDVTKRLPYLNSKTLNRASEIVEKLVFQSKEKDWHGYFSLLLKYSKGFDR